MVHKNIHDETLGEALEHENGLTVLGFKFQFVKDGEMVLTGMDTLAKIAENYLVVPDSKFDKKKLKEKVIDIEE